VRGFREFLVFLAVLDEALDEAPAQRPRDLLVLVDATVREPGEEQAPRPRVDGRVDRDGRESGRERVDLAALLDRASGELRDIAGERGVDATIAPARGEVPAAVEPELADRLLIRLFGALADRAEPRERLYVSAETPNASARISISRPAALRDVSDAELFNGAAEHGFEGGFSLRLARGLARIAGGDLVSSRDAFSLVFPRA